MTQPEGWTGYRLCAVGSANASGGTAFSRAIDVKRIRTAPVTRGRQGREDEAPSEEDDGSSMVPVEKQVAGLGNCLRGAF